MKRFHHRVVQALILLDESVTAAELREVWGRLLGENVPAERQLQSALDYLATSGRAVRDGTRYRVGSDEDGRALRARVLEACRAVLAGRDIPSDIAELKRSCLAAGLLDEGSVLSNTVRSLVKTGDLIDVETHGRRGLGRARKLYGLPGREYRREEASETWLEHVQTQVKTLWDARLEVGEGRRQPIAPHEVREAILEIGEFTEANSAQLVANALRALATVEPVGLQRFRAPGKRNWRYAPLRVDPASVVSDAGIATDRDRVLEALRIAEDAHGHPVRTRDVTEALDAHPALAIRGDSSVRAILHDVIRSSNSPVTRLAPGRGQNYWTLYSADVGRAWVEAEDIEGALGSLERDLAVIEGLPASSFRGARASAMVSQSDKVAADIARSRSRGLLVDRFDSLATWCSVLSATAQRIPGQGRAASTEVEEVWFTAEARQFLQFLEVDGADDEGPLGATLLHRIRTVPNPLYRRRFDGGEAGQQWLIDRVGAALEWTARLSPKPDFRDRAEHLLALLGEIRDVDWLVRLADAEEGSIQDRMVAVETLGYFAAEDAVRAVRRHLTSPDWRLRWAALLSGGHCSPLCPSEVRGVLNDERAEVRQAASLRLRVSGGRCGSFAC